MMLDTKSHLVDQIRSINGKSLSAKEELGKTKTTRFKRDFRIMIYLFIILDRLNYQLKLVHSTPKDHLRTYGDFMPSFIAALEKQYKMGKFSKLPIGPLGNHIEVIDPKYRRCVEDVLRPMINAFCVDNANDRKVLGELMKKHLPKKSQFSVITSKFMDKVSFKHIFQSISIRKLNLFNL